MASNDNFVPLRRLSGEDCRRISSDQVITSVPSVVKELVENALDATATRISITLKGFGFEVIEVQDNGCGINKEDREKLGLRHFTSKLRSFRDLEDGKCHSYGFRGEAINSLCEQSREVFFQTKVRREPTADRMLLDKHGHKVSITKVPQASCGSIVQVLGLFSSRPVRIPKAKGKEKQEAEVVNLFLEYCLSNPHVFFQLRTSKKYLFRGREKTNNLSKPPLSTRSEVFKQLFGADVHQELQLFEWELEVNEMEEEEEEEGLDEDKEEEIKEHDQEAEKKRSDENVPEGSNIRRVGAAETLPDAKVAQHQSRGNHVVRNGLLRDTTINPMKLGGIEGSDGHARENDEKRFQDTLASLATYQATTEHIDVVGDGSAACLSTRSKLVGSRPRQSSVHATTTRSIDEARRVVNKAKTTHSPSFRYSIAALLPKADAEASLCTRSDSSRLFTFINNRPVTLPSLHSLLARHYRSLFEGGQHDAACKSAGRRSFKRRFPVGLVSIQADAAAVDVNVTPDKRVVAMVGAKQLLRSFSQQLRKQYPIYKQDRQQKQRPAQNECSEQTMTERSEEPLSLHRGHSEKGAATQVTCSEVTSRDSRSVKSCQGSRSPGSENLAVLRRRDSGEPSDGPALARASSFVLAQLGVRNDLETQQPHVNTYTEAAYTPTRGRVRSREDLLSITASTESEAKEYKREVTQVFERGEEEQSSGDVEVTHEHMDLKGSEQTPRDWANICEEVYRDMISDSGSDTDEIIEEDHNIVGSDMSRSQKRKTGKPKKVLENADDTGERRPPVSILTGHRGSSLHVLPGRVTKPCTSSVKPAQQTRPLRSFFSINSTRGRPSCIVHSQSDPESARDEEDNLSVQVSARHSPSKHAVNERDDAEGPTLSHERVTENDSVDHSNQKGHVCDVARGSPSLGRQKIRNSMKGEDIRRAAERQAACSTENEASKQTLQQSKDCGPSNFDSAFRELSVGPIPRQRHATCITRKRSENTSTPHSSPSLCGERLASRCIPSSIERVSAIPLSLETEGKESRRARAVVALNSETGIHSNNLYDLDKRVPNNESGLHSETLIDSGTRVLDNEPWMPSETLYDSDERVLDVEAEMESEALYDSDKRVWRDSKDWINEIGEEIIDTDELSQSLQSPPSIFSEATAEARGRTTEDAEARQDVSEDDGSGQGLIEGVEPGSVLTKGGKVRQGPSTIVEVQENPPKKSEDAREVENGGKPQKDSGELTNPDRTSIDDEHQNTTDAEALGIRANYSLETECSRKTAVGHVVDTGQFFEEYRANAWRASREAGLGEAGEIPRTLIVGRVPFSSGCSSFSPSSSSPPLSSSSSSFSSSIDPPRKKSRLRLRSDRKKDREQRSANASFALSDHPPRCYIARVGDALYAIADHQQLFNLKEKSEKKKPDAQTHSSGTKGKSEGSASSLATSEPLDLLRTIVEVTTGQEKTILHVNDLCEADVIVHLCQLPARSPCLEPT